MKEIVDILIENNIICKKLKKIDIKVLGIKKRLDVYIGVNLSNFYCIIFHLKNKSRFISRNKEEVLEILEKIELNKDTKFAYKKKMLILNSQICSKTKKDLQNLGWRVF